MDNNWIIDNLNYAFGVWNDKLTEMWSLLSQSPQAFKGGTIWQTIQTVNGAMQGIGYGLLVLFLAIGIFRSSASFRDFQRPEHVLRHFIYFVMAKLAVTYGIDLMVDIFAVCAGIISAAAGSVGGIDGATVSLPAEMAAAIEDVGFLASIPLWLVTLLGCLLITVLAFLLILTVYGRFFKLFLYAALSPVALASFAGERHVPDGTCLSQKLYGRVSGGRSDRAGLHRVFGLRCQRHGRAGRWFGGHTGVGLSWRGHLQYAGAGRTGEGCRPRGEGDVWDVREPLTFLQYRSHGL